MQQEPIITDQYNQQDSQPPNVRCKPPSVQKQAQNASDLQHIIKQIEIDFKLELPRQATKKIDETLEFLLNENQSDQYYTFLKDIITLVNREAIKCMNNQSNDFVEFLISYCQRLINDNGEYPEILSPLVLCLNTQACYCRRVNQYEKSLQILQQCELLFQQNNQLLHQDLTFLNIGALLYEKQKYASSLEYSSMATNLFYSHYKVLKEQQGKGNEDQSKSFNDNNQEFLQLTQNLTAALFNVASSQWRVGQIEESKKSFSRALHIARNHLGDRHIQTLKILETMEKLHKKQFNVSNSTASLRLVPQQQNSNQNLAASSEQLIQVDQDVSLNVEDKHPPFNYNVSSQNPKQMQKKIVMERVLPFRQSYNVSPNEFRQRNGKVIILKSSVSFNKKMGLYSQYNKPHAFKRLLENGTIMQSNQSHQMSKSLHSQLNASQNSFFTSSTTPAFQAQQQGGGNPSSSSFSKAKLQHPFSNKMFSQTQRSYKNAAPLYQSMDQFQTIKNSTVSQDQEQQQQGYTQQLESNNQQQQHNTFTENNRYSIPNIKQSVILKNNKNLQYNPLFKNKYQVYIETLRQQQLQQQTRSQIKSINRFFQK